METRPFAVFGATRRTGTADTLTVYVESDGFAWRNPYTPSDDPTPNHPVGLRLALADGAPEIVYLGRPCQYANLVHRKECEPRYWTTHRLAPEVISSLSDAINQAKQDAGARTVELVGYSGGGAAAVLIASRRSDVVRIVTIAANLDLTLWSELNDVRPMSGSLDPAAHASAVAAIPQRHLVGRDDAVVPAAVARSFAAKAGLPQTAVEEIRGKSHECCWHEDWGRRIGAVRAATPSS